jgi:hypothetical protein
MRSLLSGSRLAAINGGFMMALSPGSSTDLAMSSAVTGEPSGHPLDLEPMDNGLDEKHEERSDIRGVVLMLP